MVWALPFFALLKGVLIPEYLVMMDRDIFRFLFTERGEPQQLSRRRHVINVPELIDWLRCCSALLCLLYHRNNPKNEGQTERSSGFALWLDLKSPLEKWMHAILSLFKTAAASTTSARIFTINIYSLGHSLTYLLSFTMDGHHRCWMAIRLSSSVSKRSSKS